MSKIEQGLSLDGFLIEEQLLMLAKVEMELIVKLNSNLFGKGIVNRK